MDFKVDEIEEHAKDYIMHALKYNADYIDENDIYDIHHDIFNTDYYIIGRYEARKWCEDEVFNIIGFIKEYELFHFGESATDFSEPEHVVNMYVYIIGEEIIENVIDEVLYEQGLKEQDKTKQNTERE